MVHERRVLHCYTDKKENKIFLIYDEIQSGEVAKSYMRKGFLILYIYEKCANISPYMRRPLVIYDFATAPETEFPYIQYKETLVFFFYQCRRTLTGDQCGHDR
jgi:hypothetical protein